MARKYEEMMLEGVNRKPSESLGKNSDKRIPEEYFPPCIKKGLLGIADGRKRFVFVLINFLKTANWSAKDIEEKIQEFNKKNPEPLDETYIKGQLSYSEKRADKFPPPNCASSGYYQDLKICERDPICGKIKNPIAYPVFKGMGRAPERKKKRSGKGI